MSLSPTRSRCIVLYCVALTSTVLVTFSILINVDRMRCDRNEACVVAAVLASGISQGLPSEFCVHFSKRVRVFGVPVQNSFRATKNNFSPVFVFNCILVISV